MIIIIMSDRASRCIRPPRCLTNTFCTCQLFHSALFRSISTALVQVVFGPPFALRPSGDHPNAVKQLFTSPFLSMINFLSHVTCHTHLDII